MAKSASDLKILLLQIREDEETMLEEYFEFVQCSGLKEKQFTKLNTFKTADFEPSIIEGYDALFVGGSSDASVLNTKEFKFVINCKRLLRHCYTEEIPVFASCFGFQAAVEELGGKVILDKENMEMGIIEIHLTENARNDILLHDMPTNFWAVTGHKERALEIPTDAIPMGYSEDCPHHLFKMKGKPFYAFQFHPEMDKVDLRARLIRYQERYLKDPDAMQAIIEKMTCDTPHANSLVKKFIERILLS